MRTEKDFIGEITLPSKALYGIHSVRARHNFPSDSPFSLEWYKAIGTVKLACYATVIKLVQALKREHPDLIPRLNLPSEKKLGALESAAAQVATGSHFEHFIVSGVQGGAGTSINLNINEIISNIALMSLGKAPGDYKMIDPIETANIFQSTNDVIPTALTLAVMKLLNELEESINQTRQAFEQLESIYRNSLRIGYTQLQEAVPSTYGRLFSTYSEAMSRDWWRVSKGLERIKVVNLGGGAIGTGISIPRFFIMEVVPELKKLTSLPITQGENLADATSNMDKWVEVHAILKAHAVNLEKITSDLRLLASDLSGSPEIELPAKQVGSSIMPGKVNPVIAEYVISSSHRIYSNDQLISSLAAQGCLELNAYLPEIGRAFLESLELMITMNRSIHSHMLKGLQVREERAREKLFHCPAITTVLSPLIGYNRAAILAKRMKETGEDIFYVNKELNVIEQDKLDHLMEADNLLKKGFTMSDIREIG